MTFVKLLKQDETFLIFFEDVIIQKKSDEIMFKHVYL
jgi:hypothetical protein